MSTRLLGLANEALLRGRFEQAIRLYSEILVWKAAIREFALGNLKLARRRYRAAAEARPQRVAICAGPSIQRWEDLRSSYQAIGKPERIYASTVGASLKADGADHVLIASDASAFAPVALEFVLAQPFDVVHLCEDDTFNLLLGLLYKIFWDARVVLDVKGGRQASSLAALRSGPDENWRAAFLGASFFDLVFDGEAPALGVRAPSVPAGAGGSASLAENAVVIVEKLGGWDKFQTPREVARALADLRPDARRLIVYSVLTGDYEGLKEPEVIDPRARYLLFSDNPKVASRRWEVVYFDPRGLSARRASRLPKMLPHLYLPEHEASIYVDASLAPIMPDVGAVTATWLENCDLAAYRHFSRDCVFAEIDACLRESRIDNADAEAVRRQLAAASYPERNGLLENAFLIRRHTRAMRRVNELWFRAFMTGAERDQFYFMPLLWQARTPFAIIDDASDFRSSPHVIYTKHAASPPRGMDKAAADVAAALGGLSVSSLGDHFDELLNSAQDAASGLCMTTLSCLVETWLSLDVADSHVAKQKLDCLARLLFPRTHRHDRELSQRKIGVLSDPNDQKLNDGQVSRIHERCLALSRDGAQVLVYSKLNDLGAACDAAGVRLRPLAEVKGGDWSIAAHALVRQALAGGCTDIYTTSLDVAVSAAIAGLPLILELHKTASADDMRLEFVVRSSALEKLVLSDEALARRCRALRRGIDRRVLVLGGDEGALESLWPPAVGPAPRAGPKPIVNWMIGGKASAGWAYENNTKRLAAHLPQYDHRIDSAENADCTVYFDALIHKKHGGRPGPCILRLGGPNPLRRVYGESRADIVRGIAQFDAIVALSGELTDLAAASGKPVTCVPNGLDLSAYTARRTRAPGPFVVGFAGNCKSEMERNFKGIEFAEEGARLAGVQFLALKKQENQIPHERMVPDFYHKIDCLVHPVAKGKEGSSNVIMEALACGVPVITTRFAGFHAESLVDGESVLFCERDATDIRDKIVLLRDNDDLCARLSKEGRAFAERRHCIRRVARQYAGVLDAVLKRAEKSGLSRGLRIGLVTRSFWPKVAGMEMMVHNLATALSRMDHDVVLFAGEHRGKYREIEHEYVLERYQRSARGLREAFAKQHAQRPFDILYVQGAHDPASWTLEIKKEFGVPVVLRTHGDDIQVDRDINYGLRLDPVVETQIVANLNSTDANVAIGPHILDETVQLAPDVTAALIHNGVDTDRFAEKKSFRLHDQLGLPRDTKILLTVGRNVRKKSFHLAVEALAMVRRLYPKVALVHVGKDGDGEDLAAAAARAGVSDAFFRVGEIDYFTMPEIYASADIFVFPAKAETFGNVTVEAMAAGLPCVEFDYVVNRDKIVHGESGFIVDYGDVPTMARHIVDLLQDDLKRAAFAAAGRRHVSQAFAWPVVAGKYLELFRTVLASSRRDADAATEKQTLRVAIVADKFVNIKGGGGEKSLADLANALSERGHEVFVVIKEANVSPFQKPFYPLNSSVKLRNIFGWGEQNGSKSNREALLAALVREISPDVVIGFFLPEFGFVAEGLRHIDVPLVLSHRNDPEQKMSDLERRHPRRLPATAYAYERCQLMTVQMGPYLSMLPEETRKKAVVIPNAVPPARESMFAQPDREEPRNTILNVGRLASAKNQKLLIAAFARIAGGHPSWDLKIYGDGPLEAEIRELIASLNMQDRILLMGTVSDIEPVYRDAKIFAFPSLYEGFSRALAEAMMHRLPSLCLEECICSRDFLMQSGGGLLCSDDVSAYANGLEALIADPAMRRQMGEKAAAFIAQFAPQRVFDLWERHLSGLVRGYSSMQGGRAAADFGALGDQKTPVGPLPAGRERAVGAL